MKMSEVEFNYEIGEITMQAEYVGCIVVKPDPDEGLFNLGEVLEKIKAHAKGLGWDVNQLQYSSQIIHWGNKVTIYFHTQEFLDSPP